MDKPLADQLTDRALVTSLRSTKCPACGRTKKVGQTLCLADYRALPIALRRALYARLGEGYREAVIEAFQFLEVTTFQVDPPEAARG